jgi:hypothetical protein
MFRERIEAEMNCFLWHGMLNVSLCYSGSNAVNKSYIFNPIPPISFEIISRPNLTTDYQGGISTLRAYIINSNQYPPPLLPFPIPTTLALLALHLNSISTQSSLPPL